MVFAPPATQEAVRWGDNFAPEAPSELFQGRSIGTSLESGDASVSWKDTGPQAQKVEIKEWTTEKNILSNSSAVIDREQVC